MIKTNYKCRRCEETKHYTDFEKSIKTNWRRSRTCIICTNHMNKVEEAQGTANNRAIMAVAINPKSTHFYYMKKVHKQDQRQPGMR